MSSVKSAFMSLVEKINNQSIFSLTSIHADKTKEIRYSKKNDFNEETVEKYLKKKINLDSIKFDNKMLKDPYFLKSDA